MDPTAAKSVEELRWEDYSAGLKSAGRSANNNAPAASSLLATLPQTAALEIAKRLGKTDLLSLRLVNRTADALVRASMRSVSMRVDEDEASAEGGGVLARWHVRSLEAGFKYVETALAGVAEPPDDDSEREALSGLQRLKILGTVASGYDCARMRLWSASDDPFDNDDYYYYEQERQEEEEDDGDDDDDDEAAAANVEETANVEDEEGEDSFEARRRRRDAYGKVYVTRPDSDGGYSDDESDDEEEDVDGNDRFLEPTCHSWRDPRSLEAQRRATQRLRAVLERLPKLSALEIDIDHLGPQLARALAPAADSLLSLSIKCGSVCRALGEDDRSETLEALAAALPRLEALSLDVLEGRFQVRWAEPVAGCLVSLRARLLTFPNRRLPPLPKLRELGVVDLGQLPFHSRHWDRLRALTRVEMLVPPGRGYEPLIYDDLAPAPVLPAALHAAFLREAPRLLSYGFEGGFEVHNPLRPRRRRWQDDEFGGDDLTMLAPSLAHLEIRRGCPLPDDVNRLTALRSLTVDVRHASAPFGTLAWDQLADGAPGDPPRFQTLPALMPQLTRLEVRDSRARHLEGPPQPAGASGRPSAVVRPDEPSNLVEFKVFAPWASPAAALRAAASYLGPRGARALRTLRLVVQLPEGGRRPQVDEIEAAAAEGWRGGALRALHVELGELELAEAAGGWGAARRGEALRAIEGALRAGLPRGACPSLEAVEVALSAGARAAVPARDGTFRYGRCSHMDADFDGGHDSDEYGDEDEDDDEDEDEDDGYSDEDEGEDEGEEVDYSDG